MLICFSLLRLDSNGWLDLSGRQVSQSSINQNDVENLGWRPRQPLPPGEGAEDGDGGDGGDDSWASMNDESRGSDGCGDLLGGNSVALASFWLYIGGSIKKEKIKTIQVLDVVMTSLVLLQLYALYKM